MPTEFSFEIVQELGVLSESPTGWRKELNLVSYNGKPAKYDIRDWSPDRAKMGKGATLTADEMILLRDMLSEIDI